METDLLSGRHVDPTSGRERFGVFAERWLEARDLGPRTRDTYASQLAHILDEFEPVELRKITPSAVRAWHGRLSKSGLHQNTVAKVYRLFRTMRDTGVDDGLLRTNPVHIKGLSSQALDRATLDWDHIGQIADAIHPRFRALVRVGNLGSSLRRVDRRDSSPRRHRGPVAPGRPGTMVREGRGPNARPTEVSDRSSHRGHPSRVAEMFAAHTEEHVTDEPDALVFTSVKDGPLVNRCFAPYWKKALKAAGPDESIRFHDLRHHAGTSAATAGASLREIMARMGHASSDASLRYLKASARRDAEIADAMELRMNGDLGG